MKQGLLELLMKNYWVQVKRENTISDTSKHQRPEGNSGQKSGAGAAKQRQVGGTSLNNGNCRLNYTPKIINL
jgi:hypothetical protein